jgi:hypothetical protein
MTIPLLTLHSGEDYRGVSAVRRMGPEPVRQVDGKLRSHPRAVPCASHTMSESPFHPVCFPQTMMRRGPPDASIRDQFGMTRQFQLPF